MLINQIKQDQINARKAREKTRATILTTLIGEADMIGKNAGNRAPDDAEVLACIRKFIKGMEEVKKFEHVETTEEEQRILEEYLPQEMADCDLQDVIHGIVMERGYGLKDMGKVMTDLRTNYTGLYDGKKAAGFVKMILQQVHGGG